MKNIEKDFFEKIKAERDEQGVALVFHLVELGAISTTNMEMYLIRRRWQEERAKGTTARKAAEIIGDEFCKAPASIIYCAYKVRV
jgi:hypothetical protein